MSTRRGRHEGLMLYSSVRAGRRARRTLGSSAARARSSTTSRCPACCTGRSCAARSRTPGSSRSTRPRRCAHPMVEAVITGEDLAERGLAWMPTLSVDVQAVLATDKVRFQGQEVAFVVARDRYSASDALELINVEYEPLPVVVDARTALDPGAPVIRDDLAGQDRQPDLRLERRATRRPPSRVFAAGRRGDRPGHAVPAVASGSAGDLRRRGGPGRGQRQAHDLADHARHRTRTGPCTR